MRRRDDFEIETLRSGNDPMMIAIQSPRRRASAGVTLALLGCAVAFAACSETNTDLGGDRPTPPSFVDPDAQVTPPSAGLVEYCATSACPDGFTTCPNSRFSCDVNLRTDKNNCGSCGFRCPTDTSSEMYACLGGSCVMTCDLSALDCDGVVDNGCEVAVGSDNSNCGACGVQCSDPEKPCVAREIMKYGCGCTDGKILCPGVALARDCIDATRDDDNCGRCGNGCPKEDGRVLPANTYLGCYDSQCGTIKCNSGWADCDGDPANGCEINVASDEHCGGCNIACPDGSRCGVNMRSYQLECLCPAGQTRCSEADVAGVLWASCIDLSSENDACGACNKRCDSSVDNGFETCTYGKCVRRCLDGYADCDGNDSNGCEVDVHSDPRNCGGCGITCDLGIGQACIRGRCAVAPCESLDDGGLAR